VLLVEQYFEFALKLADHCYVMEKGAIVMSGKASELDKEAIKPYLAFRPWGRMKAVNFLYIVATAAALSGYSFWSAGQRERLAPPVTGARFVADIPLLRTAEAESLWRRSSSLFVDVRSRFDYESGHIPGAVNLPDEEFEIVFPTLQRRLERAEALVVYCKSTDCGKSLWSAIRLRQKGLQQTKIYPEGWNEWSTSGLPVARAGK
jgi:rhodanese-related sulfurtransferase